MAHQSQSSQSSSGNASHHLQRQLHHYQIKQHQHQHQHQLQPPHSLHLHHHWDSPTHDTATLQTASISSQSRYDTLQPSITSSTSASSHQSHISSSGGSSFFKQHHHNSSGGSTNSQSSTHHHHGKHSKHGKRGSLNKDDRPTQQHQQISGGISTTAHDRPSIQQTVNSIPPMLQHDSNNGDAGDAMIGGDLDMGESDVLQEWLQKRSTSLQLVWKRRWCVLRDDKLYFYRSNTDTKPLGVLNLAEYSILAFGAEISRKSKFTIRLSSPDPIPHQHQHHLFHTETAQSLQNWVYALQVHINRATATWAAMTMASGSTGLGLQMTNQRQASAGREQSIIDKVLDRLQLEGSAPSDMNDASALTTAAYQNSRASQPPVSASSTASMGTAGAAQGQLPYLSSNFPQSYEDNNDTWSSTSSMPNTSTNTSSNLEYIFTLNQQNQQPLQMKSSMDSTRDLYQAQHSPVGPQPSGNSGTQLNYAGSYSSSNGYPGGSSLSEQQSNMSETNRSSLQSIENQGRTSLQQQRAAAQGHGFHAGSSSTNSFMHQQQSPHVYPVRSSVHSSVSMDNSAASSAAGSPYSSPVLASQSQGVFNNGPGNSIPSSPRTFYRVLENSSPKRAESIGSSTSVSTIASSGDVSTINDLASDNGLGTTATTESNQGKSSGNSHGAMLLGLVTGGKYKKEKERRVHSSASSSHSGSGSASSPALKLFSSGVCSFSGCTQPAKTCTFHSKRCRQENPKKNKNKDKCNDKDKDEGKKLKKFWSGADKNHTQGSSSAIVSPLFNSDGTPLTFSGQKSSKGIMSSKSMSSLLKGGEFVLEAHPVPVPSNHMLSLLSSPTRRRSPSVSVVDDALVATQLQQLQRQRQQQQQQQQQQQKIQQLYSLDPIPQATGVQLVQPRTPPTTAPTKALPPPPPRATSSASNHRPHPHDKESLSLSKKMGLQIGGDFGALDKTGLAGATMDGNFFVANHHRTMQKLQVMQNWKNQPTGPLPAVPGTSRSPQPQGQQPQQQHEQVELQKQQDPRQSHQQQQQHQQHQQQHQQHQQQHHHQQQQTQTQTNLYNGGVSRHIVAPDELALAIEQEAEEMRRQQAQDKEAQRNRPTSMIKGNGYQSLPIHLSSLSTVSETSTLTDGGDSLGTSQFSSPRERQAADRIISSQEQLAYGSPADQEAIEDQRSPISGITSAQHTLSPTPTSPLPPTLSHNLSESSTATTASGNEKTNGGYGSSYSTPLSAGSSEVSSPGSYLASLNKNHHHPMELKTPPPYTQQQYEQQARLPASPLSSLLGERQDFLTTSLPPPKRHRVASQGSSASGNGGGVDSRMLYQGGPPRRSSAAAAVTLSTTGADAVNGQDALKSTSGENSGMVRPAYMTRRQSSSPVMIRLSEHGAQNISPLLSTGATRTFVGDAPEIRRPGLTPISSPAGSTFSTSTASSSLCSFITARYIGAEQHAEEHLAEDHVLTLSEEEGGVLTSSSRNRNFQSKTSLLAAVMPAEGSVLGSPASKSMIHTHFSESLTMSRLKDTEQAGQDGAVSGDKTSTTAAAAASADDEEQRQERDGISHFSTATNQPRGPSSSSKDPHHLHQVAPKRMMLHPAASFVFPAPSVARSKYTTANGRPLSSSSVDSFYSDDVSESEGAAEASVPQSEHSSRGGSPVLSPHAHALHAAAAFELYPGLRKLSLFTAAHGGHPPPALLGSRKGSAGSTSTAAYTEADEQEEEEDDWNDEDWAGNLKSTRKLKEPPVAMMARRRMSLPMTSSPLVTAVSSASESVGLDTDTNANADASATVPANVTAATRPTGLPAPEYDASELFVSTVSDQPATLPPASPPAVPPRSPHRSAPNSPTNERGLKSPRSMQYLQSAPKGALPPVPVIPSAHANWSGQSGSSGGEK